MFNQMIAPLPSPCHNCAERCFNCWSGCKRYIDYRKTIDRIHAQDKARRAVEEAGVLRGDKIRRDVHKYGLYERKKRWN